MTSFPGPTVLYVDAKGAPIESDRDATDLIGEAMGLGTDVVVIPVERLSADFFQLETRKAGLFIQKFTNYRMKLVVLGDISAHLAASRALTDFVREANGKGSVWFLPDVDAIPDMLRSL
jgi:hypothetical protein